jgi:hypothetical protein
MAEIQGATDVEINVGLLRHMVINAIRSYKMKFGHDFGQLVIATDNRKYWRREYFPHYKASRKKSRADSGLDWHAIFEALDQIRSELDTHFPYPVLNVDLAEADDIIAALVEWTQENELTGAGVFDVPEPQPVLILSGDGDFVQLQRHKNVKQYSPIHKKWIVADASPDEVIMEHVLSGDKGDGVPNFLSADDTFVIEGGRQKSLMKKDLAQWKTQEAEEFIEADSPLMKNFRRNQVLIDLRCIPKKVKRNVIKQYLEKREKTTNKSDILNFFIKNHMKLLIEHTGEF